MGFQCCYVVSVWVGSFGDAGMCTVARASLNQLGFVVSVLEISVVVVVGFGFCGDLGFEIIFWGLRVMGWWLGHGRRGFDGHGFGGRGLWDVWVWHGLEFWLWVVVVRWWWLCGLECGCVGWNVVV